MILKKKTLPSNYVHIASSLSKLINFVIRIPRYVLWKSETSTDIVHVNTLECKYIIRHLTSISFFLFFWGIPVTKNTCFIYSSILPWDSCVSNSTRSYRESRERDSRIPLRIYFLFSWNCLYYISSQLFQKSLVISTLFLKVCFNR